MRVWLKKLKKSRRGHLTTFTRFSFKKKKKKKKKKNKKRKRRRKRFVGMKKR
jgi:hypothetical protein